MDYKPIEYKDFGYGGKHKDNNLIKIINFDDKLDNNKKNIREYLVESTALIHDPRRVFRPILDLKSDKNNYGNSNKW